MDVDMTSDYSEETEDYYKAQYARLREKMNCKNYKIWDDYKLSLIHI